MININPLLHSDSSWSQDLPPPIPTQTRDFNNSYLKYIPRDLQRHLILFLGDLKSRVTLMEAFSEWPDSELDLWRLVAHKFDYRIDWKADLLDQHDQFSQLKTAIKQLILGRFNDKHHLVVDNLLTAISTSSGVDSDLFNQIIDCARAVDTIRVCGSLYAVLKNDFVITSRSPEEGLAEIDSAGELLAQEELARITLRNWAANLSTLGLNTLCLDINCENTCRKTSAFANELLKINPLDSVNPKRCPNEALTLSLINPHIDYLPRELLDFLRLKYINIIETNPRASPSFPNDIDPSKLPNILFEVIKLSELFHSNTDQTSLDPTRKNYLINLLL